MNVSLRAWLRQQSGNAVHAGSVRSTLNATGRSLRLRRLDQGFSILIQNMGLMVPPGPYLGTDRQGAFDTLLRTIRSLQPDVVGLCEVYSDSERDLIRQQLADLYLNYREGPDERDLESDGGLLLLTRAPMTTFSQVVFDEAVWPDSFSNKGVLFAQIHNPQLPDTIDLYLSHAQNIKEDGGRAALYSQLDQMADLVRSTRQATGPALIFGDLNIPAQNPADYAQMLIKLGQPVDLWTALGHSVDGLDGCTFVAANNFYEDDDDNPKFNERLDYLLMLPGQALQPVFDRVEVLRMRHQGRDVSDHFGIYAVASQCLQIEPL